MTNVDAARVVKVAFLLGLLPATFAMVNSQNYFKGGIIYIVIALIGIVVYWRGKLL